MKSHYKYQPVIYYTAIFTATLVLWFAGAYVSLMENNIGMHVWFLLPGLMAPFIISLVMLFISKESVLKKNFFNRLFNFKLIHIKYILVL